jgi:group I intron endonuclease
MDPGYIKREDIEIQLELIRPEIKIVYTLEDLSNHIAVTYNTLYPRLKKDTIGIYCIKNKINGKVYIGQSWDIKSRWSHHKSLKSPHLHLKSAFLKYGLINFSISILKEIEKDENTQKNLDYYETYFINFYNSMNKNLGYNKKEGSSHGKLSQESIEKSRKAKIGKSINKGVPKTPEARMHMSIAHADVNGNKNPMYGKSHSLKSKIEMSEKAKKRTGSKNGFFGKQLSKEHKEKLIQSLKKKLGVRVICHDNNTIYSSINEAAKSLNLHFNTVAKICRGLKARNINVNLSFYND